MKKKKIKARRKPAVQIDQTGKDNLNKVIISEGIISDPALNSCDLCETVQFLIQQLSQTRAREQQLIQQIAGMNRAG